MVHLGKAKEPIMVPKDIYLVISSGCYSDYSIRGFFKTKEALDISSLMQIFFSKHKFGDYTQRKENPALLDDWNKDEYFVKFLISEGLIEQISYSELYTGDYNSDRLTDNGMDFYEHGIFLGNNGI